MRDLCKVLDEVEGSCTNLTPQAKGAILMLVKNAYIYGYRIGVADAGLASIDAVEEVQKNLCILSKIMDERSQPFEENQTVMGVWAGCENISTKLVEALSELTGETH